MVAMLPVLAISLLLGGVTYAEFARVALTAINILFLSLAIGMFASAVCIDEGRELCISLLIAIVLGAYAPLAGWAWSESTGGRYNEVFNLPSPVTSVVLSFVGLGSGSTHAQEFWSSTAFTHCYAWILLLLACFIVPHSWKDKASSPRRENIQAKWTDVTQGDVAARKVFRRNLLEINSFYWLAARDKFKAKMIWIVLFVVTVIWIWAWAAIGKDFPNPATYIFTALVLHTLLKSWIAAEASVRFVEDRRSGAMELLLCTPLKDQEILRGQRLALLKQFGWPVFIVLAVDLLFFGLGSTEMHGDITAWVWCWLVGVGMFVMDLFALSWVAIWTGLTNNKTNRASGAAATRILVLPWLVFGLTLTAFGILTEFPLFRFLRQINFPDWFPFVYWFAIGAVNNLLWMKWAKGNLRTKFRTAATQRFDVPRRFNWFGLRK
jgi:ABC-type transport system involved in cytochrome c biogenesis permease component